MELTEKEKENWIKFRTSYKPRKDTSERDTKIIQLCKEGATNQKLNEEVTGSWGDISDVKMKARGEGVY